MLTVILSIAITDLVLVFLTSAIAFAIKQSFNLIRKNPSPYVRVKLKDGKEIKIFYEGKADSQIAKELTELISQNEVASVTFVS